MGNYKFRLSDMMPNAWFYKLKDMSKVRNNHHKKKLSEKQTSFSTSSSSKISDNSNLSDQRKSYHFTRDLNNLPQNSDKVSNLVEPPRKSSKRRKSVKRNNRPVNKVPPRLVSSSVSAGCSCRATLESVWTKPNDTTPEEYPDSSFSSSEHESMLPEYGSDTFDGMVSLSTSCECKAHNDIVIEVGEFRDSVPELKSLPPIITKKPHTIQVVNENILIPSKTTSATTTSPVKRLPINSPGVKLRTNTPKIANLRINQGGRKSVSSNSSSASTTRRRSVSESFAVVKSSKDPRRDFRESMVEMIIENNISGSKDLEELLACYLSLNSDEYHDLIINVFKQIWFDFVRVSLK